MGFYTTLLLSHYYYVYTTLLLQLKSSLTQMPSQLIPVTFVLFDCLGLVLTEEIVTFFLLLRDHRVGSDSEEGTGSDEDLEFLSGDFLDWERG